MKNCVGVCSDGAAAMIEKKSGVITRIKQLAPECASTHCFIHTESLATKKLSTKLNDVLCEVVKIVNYIKGSAIIIQDYLPFYATICKQITGNYYFIPVCVGCRGEKFYHAYMSSETNWQYFCMTESQIGRSYFVMNNGLLC